MSTLTNLKSWAFTRSKNMSIKTYTVNVLIGIDQLANTLINGYPDETLSSRCYRNSKKYWYANAARICLDFVFRPFGKEHCKTSYESELNRKQLFDDSKKV